MYFQDDMMEYLQQHDIELMESFYERLEKKYQSIFFTNRPINNVALREIRKYINELEGKV